jgi:hypothetical protein
MRAEGEPLDAHAVLRALLAVRGADDRGTERAGEALRRCVDSVSAGTWEDLAAEAEYHGVAPLIEPIVAGIARASPASVPEGVRRVFVALASRHRHAAAAREGVIDQLVAAFAAADLRVILLKGAALAHLIYPRPELRPMADIDVLIEPAGLSSAVAVARDLGFEFARKHTSRLGGRMHHLPVATLTRSGFQIALEIHLDALSPNQGRSMTMAKLKGPPQVVRRGRGGDSLALGHIDMLRHLARHAFEPARRIRLIHLYDLWRYPARFHAEIDWQRLAAEFPDVIVILRLISYVFAAHDFADGPTPGQLGAVPVPAPEGIGQGMIPLSEIAQAPIARTEKLGALFDPPAWWLHGFYGVPPEKSLLVVRAVRHPAMVARWIGLRLAAAAWARRAGTS